jgi:BlaI family transcriptional regulator, penicillinase repressor
MPRRKSSHVTDAELEILRILWDRGPATVRQVHESLARGQDVRYTTVLKTMQNMFEKGLLARDESERSHVYRARLKQTDTERRLVRDFMDKVFDGATEQLVLQALNAKSVSPEDLANIRRMLDEWEQQRK